MRFTAFIAVLLLAATAGPAWAQNARTPAASTWIAPSAPLQASSPPAARAIPLSGAGLQSTLRPQGSLRGLTAGGFSGLAVAGDQAPVCRSRCANDRYVCEAANDGNCDDRWLQCTTACAPTGIR